MTKTFLVVFVALFVSQGISASFTLASLAQAPAPKSTPTPVPAPAPTPAPASNTASASATTIKSITSQPTVIAVPRPTTTSTRLQIAVGQGATQTIVNIKPENVIAINSLNRDLIDVSFSQKCFSRIL